MLFGNMLNLDRGIFVDITDTKSTLPLSKHLDSLLSIPDSLLKASAKELLKIGRKQYEIVKVTVRKPRYN